MRRIIFWDTMLFIHLLDGTHAMAQKVGRAFQQSIERHDLLMTSCLAVGEVLAGAKSDNKGELLGASIRALDFQLLPFGEDCIRIFGHLRSQNIAVADSIHLACAATSGVDLFLTEDKALHKRHVPGVKFIAGLQQAFPE